MKILIIPDVHGTHQWEKAKDYVNKVDRIVFLGDYVDSWDNQWPDQGDNLRNIIKFARENDNVDLLIGNHDWSYITPTDDGIYTSGHQINAEEIKEIIMTGMDLFKVAVKYDDWVISHAGFTKQWVNYFCNIKQFYPNQTTSEELIFRVNESMRKLDPNVAVILDWYGVFDGAGDEPTQGPLWVRPNSLLSNAYFKHQLVGHTEIVDGVDFFAKRDDNYLVVKDSARHEKIEIFDTKKKYEFFTITELARKLKRAQKKINDKKSLKG